MSKILLKEKLDNSIYRTYNRISKIQFIFSKYREIVKENKKFHNIHQGKRCFILGTGPSLREVSPELLKDEILFGVNFLYNSDFLDGITPSYYCLYDQIFHTTHIEETKRLINLFPETIFFMRTKAYKNIKEKMEANSNIHFQHCNLYQFKDFIEVDMDKSITAPFNVLLGCIQTAIYMGFSEIYLLGSDFNSFATPKVLHFYDMKNVSLRNRSLGDELKEYSTVSFHHYALQKYANSKGIKIMNLTEDSLLDAYPKEKLEVVLKR
ncbi:MAG: DUF115 domain-containing protein [Erysipelotrichia bacterium]|jgi:hypothetical protein|nr:DUF115 domain-containing protein [Erysipelotrichia bacterium]